MKMVELPASANFMFFIFLAALASGAIRDGPLSNGNFENLPAGTAVEHQTVPSWQSNRSVELVRSGDRQGAMILVVPEGRFAVRLGNEAAISQELPLVKGSRYAVTFSAARTCAQLESINVSAQPGSGSQSVDLQTLYSTRGWDPYAVGFVAEDENSRIVIANPGLEDDPSCGPILDDVSVKLLFEPDRVNGNLVINGDLEEGPWLIQNTTFGVLLPTNFDVLVSPVPGWTIESNRAVRYIDSDHFEVPQGKRAIELLSGKEGMISQMVDTKTKVDYTMTFLFGHAVKECRGPLAVMAFAGDQARVFHYAADATSTPVRASVNFTAKAEKTRVAFYSVYYNVMDHDSSSLCGPVVDDVVVMGSWADRPAPVFLGLTAITVILVLVMF